LGSPTVRFPAVSWFLVIMRLKGKAEHFAVEDTEAANATRTVKAGIFSRLFIAPKNVHFHIEHHLYPSVPFHQLPALHEALMEHTAFRERAHLTSSYVKYLVECAAFSSGQRDAVGDARGIGHQ
jgi:fatty acid desaturase